MAEESDVLLVNTQIRFTRDTDDGLDRARANCPAIPAIAFGPQASTEPVRLLEMGFDACVIGEPEEIVPAVLAELACAPPGSRRARLAAAGRAGLATHELPAPGPAPRIEFESAPAARLGHCRYDRYLGETHNAVYMASRGWEHEDAFNQPPLIYAALHPPPFRGPRDRGLDRVAAPVLRPLYAALP